LAHGFGFRRSPFYPFAEACAKILAMRRHLSAGFGAAPACFRTALHVGIVLELPAIFAALSANLGAHSAGSCMQGGAAKHEVRAGLTDLGAID